MDAEQWQRFPIFPHFSTAIHRFIPRTAGQKLVICVRFSPPSPRLCLIISPIDFSIPGHGAAVLLFNIHKVWEAGAFNSPGSCFVGGGAN